jgi:hypothetical protein
MEKFMSRSEQKRVASMKGEPAPSFEIRVEYDDGESVWHDGKSPFCTRRDRPMGMYAMMPDDTQRPLNIGYMRVSEMQGLEKLLNEILNFKK